MKDNISKLTGDCKTDAIISLLKLYEPLSMQNALPIVWKKAKNDIVWDTNNKKYIDFTSTIFVQNIGHSNKRVKKYLKKQINNNLLHSYTYATEIKLEYLQELYKITGYDKAFLLSSGTEATEAAVKLMRAYTKNKKIISFKGAMHGRTMAAELMKGSGIYKHDDFIVLDYPNSKNINTIIEKINNIKNIAGIMIEAYQGWNAETFPCFAIKKIYELAIKKKILICFDEIQSGFGRTGRLFSFFRYKIAPDLLCIGKGIGGGFPLSAVLGNKNIMDIPKIGDMSSTHSANPLACAAGLAVLKEINNIIYSYKFLHNVRLFNDLLTNLDNYLIKKIICNGFVGSLIFKSKKMADKVCKEALKRGLILVNTGRESIKIGPPLTITRKNLIKGFKILKEIIYGI